MAQNLLLEYNGGTPQSALTGQYQRGWYTPDTETVGSITGALEQRPDSIETALRIRLLAKQAIMQGIIQERLARAASMRQYRHPPEHLTPGGSRTARMKMDGEVPLSYSRLNARQALAL